MTPLLIIQFIKQNKWAQYALLAVLAAGLWFAYTRHLISLGSQQGIEKEKTAQVDSTEAARLSHQDQTKSQLEALNKRLDATEEQLQLDRQVQQQTLLALTNLASQSKAASQKVAGLSDSETHGYVVSQLGLRQPGEQSACYTPREERALADTVTQYPYCQKESAKKDSLVQGLQGELDHEDQRSSDLLKKYDVLRQDHGVLLQAYTTLYNDHPPKKHAGKCLWLWSCGRKHLALPDPKALQ